MAVRWTMAPTGEIVEVSDTIEQVRGITVAEALVQTADEIHPPESLRASLAYFERFSRDLVEGRAPSAFRGELLYFHRDGSLVPCDVMALPILDDDGTVIELRGVSVPVTPSG